MNELSEQRKTEIKKLFHDLFRKNGYDHTDSFDFSIWFMKKNYKNYKNSDYFKEILSETPTENDDIIKFILVRSYVRSRNKYFKIKVEDFVEEMADIIINLKAENKRVDKLIEKYQAYETKNVIEQNLNFYESLMKNNERMKSTIKVSISQIDNIMKGDYKISLMVSYINPNLTYVDDFSDTVKEEILEYKLNHILKIQDDTLSWRVEGNESYQFFPADFFSYELKNKMHKFDSGTNILYFYIKLENLSKNYEDIAYSDKKPILDVFLCNIKSLLSNFQKSKSLKTEVEIKTNYYQINFHLNFDVEFDPWTLSSIYGKVGSLLQDMIAYKVNLEHKWKTIYHYFQEISGAIDDLFEEKPNQDGGCLIF